MEGSKRIREVYKTVDKTRQYPVEEALKLLKEAAKVKFNETVDLAIQLGIDPKKSDQAVRGSVAVPNGLGKSVKVLVFAKGEKAEEAKAAGADFIGAEDLVEKIQGGWLDFQATVATPDMMKILGKLGKILGTRGLMPNPKTGTVTMNVGKAIKEIKAGKVEYRIDKAGIIHAPVGKISFELPALKENIKAVLASIVKARPASAKGAFLKKIYISTTMGPGIKLDPSFVEAA
ncbi:MAG: 50S ribosomal protein L1 [Elusimicrobia bacterium RIFOXYB2_FULL_49_7]|nr:MAG: 50S ribosomal protein L1 [Elusimicrobia bacterium RIFOXYB2_FULL_49_7]